MESDFLLRLATRDKVVDWALGLSAFSWAVQLAVHAGEGARSVPMDLSLGALDLVVAILFVRRAPTSLAGAPRAPLVLGLVTVASAAAALSLVPGPWAPWAQALFVCGALGTAVSLAHLDRSFAVLPARRAVVSRGPYRIVRHPAYACELAMLLAALSAGGPLAWSLGTGAVVLQVVRLLSEERLLARDPAYRRYMASVRHRLLPMLF